MGSTSTPAPFWRGPQEASASPTPRSCSTVQAGKSPLYRKIHMFDVTTPDGASYRESATVQAGREGVTYECEGVTFGCAICYDLRFPALFQALGGAAARRSSCCPPPSRCRPARTIGRCSAAPAPSRRNAIFCAPAQIGAHDVKDETRLTYGHSLVCDPWGHRSPWPRTGRASSRRGSIPRRRAGARRHSGRRTATPPSSHELFGFTFSPEQVYAIGSA